MIDNQTNKTIEQVESLLRDRFTHYMVVAVDGSDVFTTWDSNIASLGMAEYVKNRINCYWKNCEVENEDE